MRKTTPEVGTDSGNGIARERIVPTAPTAPELALHSYIFTDTHKHAFLKVNPSGALRSCRAEHYGAVGTERSATVESKRFGVEMSERSDAELPEGCTSGNVTARHFGTVGAERRWTSDPTPKLSTRLLPAHTSKPFILIRDFALI